jgi:acetylglutamate/LysW-gamma-L-alpha-aminoadipate kinase
MTGEEPPIVVGPDGDPRVNSPDGTHVLTDGGEDGSAPGPAPADERDAVVVKVGGAAAVDPGAALEDVAHLTAAGEDVVVVHGGSTVVDETLERLGETPEYVETPDGVVGRFTDATAMAAFEMALPGTLNTELVAALQDLGVRAVGLSGVDGGLLTGPRTSAVRVVEDGRRKIRRGDHSGSLQAVDTGPLDALLAGGYTPVVCPPMLAEEGTPVNVDADVAAGAVAGALGAELVVLTDVPGVLTDPDDGSTLVDAATDPAALDALHDHAEGFMTRKVMAAERALEDGATGVTVAAANRNDPVLAALAGGGTYVSPGAVADGPADVGDGDGGTDDADDTDSGRPDDADGGVRA